LVNYCYRRDSFHGNFFNSVRLDAVIMEITKQWQVASLITPEVQKNLNSYSPLVAQLLFNRGIENESLARRFFSADWQLDAHNPFSFKDMQSAVEMLVRHIKNGDLIAVAGDYDADGVTASAVVAETIKAIKGKVEVWIPSRLGEGYGLSKLIVDQVIEAGAKLLITVDNGVRAVTEVAYAREKGLEVIVTDHHTSPEGEAIPEPPLINPILERDNYPFKYLAGVGVAFKLMAGLLAESTLSDVQKERLLGKVLDLVALGTVADCVSLTGENRSLVKRGLLELNKLERPGIRALIARTPIKGVISEWHVGWQIAPRLNVAGRMEHANTALALLMTDNQKEADSLAEKVNNQNSQRQSETARIVEYCEQYIETHLMSDKLLIVISPDLATIPDTDKWLEGVIGLVAGRLCEKYSRPVLVICQSEGQIKGSGRSIESFNVVGFLGNFQEYLVRFGGHKMACGFTVKNKKALNEFVIKARDLANEQIDLKDLTPRIKIEAEVDLVDINKEFLDNLERFAPFGQGNPLPQFVSRGVRLVDLISLGSESQHWKMRFGSLWAVAWSGAKRWPELTLGQQLDIVYTAEWNEFNGYKNIQLKIVDIKINQLNT